MAVKGFSQRVLDLRRFFSSVVKMSSIQIVLGLTTTLDLEIGQMDAKTTFLHDDLEKEIYIEQPKSFVVKGKEYYVCKLKKTLYVLKQVPRQWYKKFRTILMGKIDHCVFVQEFASDDFIILSLYGDDILIVSKKASNIDEL